MNVQTADGGMVTDFEAYNMRPIDMFVLPVYPIWVLGHGVPTHSVFNTSDFTFSWNTIFINSTLERRRQLHRMTMSGDAPQRVGVGENRGGLEIFSIRSR